MELFQRMACTAAANLLGASAERRISNQQLAEELEEMALNDPDLAEHYARLLAALPVLQVQRAMEDEEIESAERRPLVDRPTAA